jgi:hypothetical protein
MDKTGFELVPARLPDAVKLMTAFEPFRESSAFRELDDDDFALPGVVASAFARFVSELAIPARSSADALTLLARSMDAVNRATSPSQGARAPDAADMLDHLEHTGAASVTTSTLAPSESQLSDDTYPQRRRRSNPGNPLRLTLGRAASLLTTSFARR